MLPISRNLPRVLFLLGILIAIVMPVSSATAQDDRDASVTAAVVDVSRTERSDDLLALHDRLQPDVRLVVSRAALRAWYTSPEAVIPSADPEILSIDFGAWTWSVSGKTYQDVATVTLRQPGIRNNVGVDQIETQHYWFDGSRWRWFFGSDRAFVEALNDQATADAVLTNTIDLIEYARIDLVWSELFDAAGRPYASLEAINAITALPTQTGCGQMTEEEYVDVFYCRLDQQIYYLPDFRQAAIRQFGAYAWPHIISHEWGHHIQRQLAIVVSEDPEIDGGLYDIELELQADCLAGVFAQEAVARGWLSVGELEDAYDVSLFAADSPDTPFDDPLAHGTGEQRQQAFTTGLEDGLYGCNLDLTL